MISVLRNVASIFLVWTLMMTFWNCAWIRPTPEPDPLESRSQFTQDELLQITLPQQLPPTDLLLPPEPKPVYWVHTVGSDGETLMAIARWYTGKGKNWQRIAQVNEALNPRRIGIGDVIRIPEEMLITRKPMPKITLKLKSRDDNAESPPPVPAAAPELFGPIETSPPSTPVGTTKQDSGVSRSLQSLD